MDYLTHIFQEIQQLSWVDWTATITALTICYISRKAKQLVLVLGYRQL